MLMLGYSFALMLALVLASPWWLWRMVRTSRYREGLTQRLGRVPAALRVQAARKTVWLHAVSVGETLAATRLVAELEAALGDGYRVVISTTTKTGHALAQQRFGAERVFYLPLDFAFSVRAYLDALRPAALVLMESELWPRTLHECGMRRIPVAVVNARVSDRSFRRALRVRAAWSRLVRKPTLWLAQSDEDARRLMELGAQPERVSISGNLKYDIVAPKETEVTRRLRELVGARPVVVAGSTVDGGDEGDEEAQFLAAWESIVSRMPEAFLILAPRHPERFADAFAHMQELRACRASELSSITVDTKLDAVCLDTIGDLASVYSLGTVAFVGGSLVERGGHNPLEPAQFGVPVVMGDSVENFRDVVIAMQAKDAICILPDWETVQAVILGMLLDPDAARAMGERGRAVFEAQQGATQRAVAALVPMIRGERG